MIKPILAAFQALPLALAAALLIGAPLQAEEQPAPSPGEIIEAAPPTDWVAIAADDLLVMTLAPDREGAGRDVVIQLMPPPFSQGWVDNIRLLARSGWYDGTAVIRVQDNYVTQWGDPNADGENAKPLPQGLKVMEEKQYIENVRTADTARDTIVLWHPKPDILDSYADSATFSGGWPVALSITQDTKILQRWPTHCYGMVGVARGMSPDTGDGSSLYTVIGHAPRHLDRNIALVGRVIEGMQHLSSLPRGKGNLGFYEDAEKRTPILSVRIASDLSASNGEAAGSKYAFQYLSTGSESFARYVEARANRRDPFFIHPAGGADICNIPVPVRRVPAD